MLPLPTAAILRQRLPRLLTALVAMGVGIALMVRADLGLGPWDVFHQGVADRAGLPIGTTAILVGLLVMLAWVPLGIRVGIGTVLNVLVVGATIDVALAVLPEIDGVGARAVALVAGNLATGLAAGAYLSVGLGTGPRDGVMTSLAARGPSIRVIRTAMEVTVLAAGFLLGGTVGVGTVLMALTIGPIIQWSLERFRLPDPLAGPPGESVPVVV